MDCHSYSLINMLLDDLLEKTVSRLDKGIKVNEETFKYIFCTLLKKDNDMKDDNYIFEEEYSLHSDDKKVSR